MSSTYSSLPIQGTRALSKLTAVAIAAMTFFVAIIVALHFLRPDLDPISRPTSEYAVGAYGYLMTSAFFSMSLASWALIIALYRGVPGPARSRIGLTLLGIWATGVLIAMLFPIDAEGAPQTMAGTIHRINGPLTFLSLTVGVALVSWRFRHDPEWRPFQRFAVILSFILLLEFIVFPVSMAAGLDVEGLIQRIFLVTFVIWFVGTALRLRSAAMESN
jgi:hypothetical protein